MATLIKMWCNSDWKRRATHGFEILAHGATEELIPKLDGEIRDVMIEELVEDRRLALEEEEKEFAEKDAEEYTKELRSLEPRELRARWQGNGEVRFELDQFEDNGITRKVTERMLCDGEDGEHGSYSVKIVEGEFGPDLYLISDGTTQDEAFSMTNMLVVPGDLVAQAVEHLARIKHIDVDEVVVNPLAHPIEHPKS